MPFTTQMYEETTNLEEEAIFFALTCIQNNIAFSINQPQSELDDRFTLQALYDETTADVLIEMDMVLRDRDHIMKNMEVNDIHSAVTYWKNR